MLHTDNNDRIEKKQVTVYTKKGLILTRTRQQTKKTKTIAHSIQC